MMNSTAGSATVCSKKHLGKVCCPQLSMDQKNYLSILFGFFLGVADLVSDLVVIILYLMDDDEGNDIYCYSLILILFFASVDVGVTVFTNPLYSLRVRVAACFGLADIMQAIEILLCGFGPLYYGIKQSPFMLYRNLRITNAGIESVLSGFLQIYIIVHSGITPENVISITFSILSFGYSFSMDKQKRCEQLFSTNLLFLLATLFMSDYFFSAFCIALALNESTLSILSAIALFLFYLSYFFWRNENEKLTSRIISSVKLSLRCIGTNAPLFDIYYDHDTMGKRYDVLGILAFRGLINTGLAVFSLILSRKSDYFIIFISALILNFMIHLVMFQILFHAIQTIYYCRTTQRDDPRHIYKTFEVNLESWKCFIDSAESYLNFAGKGAFPIMFARIRTREDGQNHSPIGFNEESSIKKEFNKCDTEKIAVGLMYAEFLYTTKQFKECVECTKKLLKIECNNHQLWHWRSMAATENFKELHYVNYHSARQQAKEFKEDAMKSIVRSLKANPWNPTAWMDAFCVMNTIKQLLNETVVLEDFESMTSKDCLIRSLEIHPEFIRCRRNIIVALVLEGAPYSEAQEHIRIFQDTSSEIMHDAFAEIVMTIHNEKDYQRVCSRF